MNVTKDQVKLIAKQLLKVESDVDKWFDKPIPFFGLKTPSQMLDEGRGPEVIELLTRFLPNGMPNEQNKRDKEGVKPNESGLPKQIRSDNKEQDTNNR